MVKELVTKNVEGGHIVFCEKASNLVTHPKKAGKSSVPLLSVKIGEHCYYGLCDIGASTSAISHALYMEIRMKLNLVSWKILMLLFSLLIEKLSVQLALLEMLKFYVVELNILLIS